MATDCGWLVSFVLTLQKSFGSAAGWAGFYQRSSAHCSGKVNKVTLSKSVPEHRLNMLWGLIFLRDQVLSKLHRQGLQQLSCSGIICVPFQSQPGSLSIMWLETSISLDNQALIYEILPCSSQRERGVPKIIWLAVDIDGMGILDRV